jgi:hypothetical protein
MSFRRRLCCADSAALRLGFCLLALTSAGCVEGAVSVGRVDRAVAFGTPWDEDETLLAGASAPKARFGQSIAFDGTTLAIGVSGESRVDLFARGAHGWTLRETVLSPVGNDGFGGVVALDGDTLAVTAKQSMTVYLFERVEADGWVLQTTLIGRDGSLFGLPIALHGDRLAVADPAGEVIYDYHRGADGSWTRDRAVRVEGTSEWTAFGYSLAMDGSALVVGSPGLPYGHAAGAAGSVFVFARDTAGGLADTPVELTAPGRAVPNAEFGASVAIAGDMVVVGAPGTSPGRREDDVGAAYWFEREPAGGWTEGRALAPELLEGGDEFGTRFGTAVAASGRVIAVATNRDDGAVHTFLLGRSGAHELGVRVLGPNYSGAGKNATLVVRGDLVIAGYPQDITADGVTGSVRMVGVLDPVCTLASQLDRDSLLCTRDYETGECADLELDPASYYRSEMRQCLENQPVDSDDRSIKARCIYGLRLLAPDENYETLAGEMRLLYELGGEYLSGAAQQFALQTYGFGSGSRENSCAAMPPVYAGMDIRYGSCAVAGQLILCERMGDPGTSSFVRGRHKEMCKSTAAWLASASPEQQASCGGAPVRRRLSTILALLDELTTEPTSWTTSVWTSKYSDDDGYKTTESYWGTIRFPDVNGDGRVDLCGRGTRGLYCALSNGSSFDELSLWTSNYSNDGDWGTSASYWGTIRFPDVNGDGTADVCGRGVRGVYCALSNGSSFDSVTLWGGFSDANAWGSNESHWGTIDFPDVNGDGKADRCGRGMSGIYCGLSTGSSFEEGTVWTSNYSNDKDWGTSESYWGTIRFPDVNGDGAADVCGRGKLGVYCALSDGSSFDKGTLWTTGYSNAEGWGDSESYWGTIRFPDVNGDGKADVCGRNSEGMYCALSTGQAFEAVSRWTSHYSNADDWLSEHQWGTIGFPDVNDDGKADVCGRTPVGVRCDLSTGSSFDSPPMWTDAFSERGRWWSTQSTSTETDWSADTSYWGTIQFPDVTGDGRASVCGRGAAGIVCSSMALPAEMEGGQ